MNDPATAIPDRGSGRKDAPLEVEQKDKKERKKDAVVQNWCLTSRAPYKASEASIPTRHRVASFSPCFAEKRARVHGVVKLIR
jgi:hypothetical protein